MDDLEFSKNVATLLQGAPAPIRDFVLDHLARVTQELMERHGLHVDQASILETELFLMLVGQSQPEQFASTLETAGIAEGMVDAILADVNREVFMPLREQMEGKSPLHTAAPTQRPMASAPAIPPTTAPKPVVPAPQPVAPTPASAPAPVPEQRPVVPAPAPTVPDMGQSMRTMASDMQAVKEHRVPEPIPYAHTPATPPPAAPTRTAPPVMPRAPQGAPPPANLPGTPLQKSYGVDPYREPLE